MAGAWPMVPRTSSTTSCRHAPTSGSGRCRCRAGCGFRLLGEPDLVSAVLRIFVRVVSAYHRRRARRRGVADGQTGAVTSIQRAGSFANANVHFHTLVPEGVWYERADGTVAFHAAAAHR